MKKLPNSVHYGLCFAVMFGSGIATIFSAIPLGFLSEYFSFVEEYFSLFFVWLYTGFCILGISLVKGDSLRVHPEEENFPTIETGKPTLSIRALQWIVRLLYGAVLIANAVVTVWIIIILVKHLIF